MEPSERCAIWRSCELIFAIAALCVWERVYTLCWEKRGGACVQGGPCGCISGSSAAMLLKSGTGRFLLGQSVCRLQSVISHLPQTGVPQSSRFSYAPAVFVGADGQNSPPASVCVFRERLSECGQDQETGYRSVASDRGVITRRWVGISQKQGGTLAQDKGEWQTGWWGPVIASAPEILSQASIQTLNSNLKVVGVKRRGEMIPPWNPTHVYLV